MRCNFALWVLVPLLLSSPDGAQAQTRSPSGRHRPTATPDSTAEAAVAVAAVPARGGTWSIGAFVGSLGGGELFRVQETEGVPVAWQTLGGGVFTSQRFNAGLERNGGFGLSLRHTLGADHGRTGGPGLSVRADIGYARLDVAAEALLGQSGAVLLYDRMSVLRVGLGLDLRLATAARYPYLGLGGGAVHLGPDLATDLEQTVPEGHVLLGYHLPVGRAMGLELEARLGKTAFDGEGFQPPVQEGADPSARVDVASSLTFFELTGCFIAEW